jgi:hypothetical protein
MKTQLHIPPGIIKYIESRQLHYLWSFQGESYFETQTGKIISLSQIEKETS